ncbi:hypothetical protein D3C80_688120 [compost metagenome]
MHRRFQRDVGKEIGGSGIEDDLHLGFGHHRRAARDLVHPRGKIERLAHFRGADQVKYFGLRLHHIRRLAAGIGDRIMHPAILRHMFAQEVDTDIHEFDGIERRTPEMGGVGGVGCNTLETVEIFQHGKIIG